MDIECCFNLAMRQSNRILTQFYEERLAQVGVKSGQFALLRAINKLKQTTNKELQEILVIDQTTLSRNLKPLIRDNLLVISTDEQDQRRKLIRLSSAGEKLYLEVLPIWQNIQRELVDKLGSKDLQQIQSLATRLTKKLTNS